jgi:hypothetical protein
MLYHVGIGRMQVEIDTCDSFYTTQPAKTVFLGHRDSCTTAFVSGCTITGTMLSIDTLKKEPKGRMAADGMAVRCGKRNWLVQTTSGYRLDKLGDNGMIISLCIDTKVVQCGNGNGMVMYHVIYY